MYNIQKISTVLFVVIALVSLTFFRQLLILLYPVFVFFIIVTFHFKITKNTILTTLIITVTSVISVAMEGNYFPNLFFSFLVVMPTVFFLTTKPPNHKNKLTNTRFFEKFFSVFTRVLVIINMSAAIYAVIVLATATYPDDIFTGLFGKGGVGAHTLSVINFLVSVKYFFDQQYKKFTFFFICGILGFYGQGLFIFILAFGMALLPVFAKNVLLIIKIALLSIGFFIIIYSINPGNFDYLNKNIAYAKLIFTEYDYDKEIKKINNYERTFVPRYFTFVDGSLRLFLSKPKVFLLGTSPGTYNSRVAFYLNGDFISNTFLRKHLKYVSSYHKERVYPISNRTYLKKTPWNDGTRNQPFSSIISLLAEYGIISGLIILFLFFNSILTIKNKLKNSNKRKYFSFLFYYSLLLFAFQYYFEVVEFMLPLLLFVKLTELDIFTKLSETNE